MKTSMDEVFDDYCIDDGHLRYVPRNQLMNAMHMLGLNPTIQNLEDIVPAGDEDTRVRYEEFQLCFEAVKHTRGYNREELISAFRVFDERGTGRLTTLEFLRAMGRSEDELQGYEQQELLMQADPDETGYVDYVAFANLLCPVHKSRSKKQLRKSSNRRTSKHKDAYQEAGVEFEHPEAEVENERVTPSSVAPETDHSLSPILITDQQEEKRKTLIKTLIRDLNITAEQEEQVRNDQKKKLQKWIDEMQSLFDERKTFTSDSVRPSLRQTDSDYEELKATLKRFDRCKEEYKASLEAQVDLLAHKRNRADNDLSTNLEKYRSDESLQPIIGLIEDILICKHRIITNTWSPICVSKSGTGVHEFLSACGGSHPDGRDRGSTPSDIEASDGNSPVNESFRNGAYLHHGTSSYWDAGVRHSNLMPEEVQGLCSEQGANSAAFQLLQLPCLLDSSNCGIDDVSEEARQKRAAFFDGVNGKECDLEELGSDALIDMYKCGQWVRDNANGSSDLSSYSCSYSLLASKWQCERTISLVETAAAEYQTLTDAVNVEEADLDTIRKEADKAIENCKKNWKTEMGYHEEDYESEMEQIKNMALKDVPQEAVGNIPDASSSSSSRPSTSGGHVAERSVSAKPKPSPKAKHVPEKKGGGCCS
eukprot:TRINITY_DN16191_c0_g1_i1.p1 TRINITY_DN16191_c0_g1~~TRINITY_DN16191_c0_g1_i1.p1  ORF type:complete len:664 (+),score=166.30 TRINITY_DN16191_c0_g1_i1:44-1993(+)